MSPSTRTEREVERVFGAWLEAELPPPREGPLPSGVTSLGGVGRDRLFAASLVPGLAARQRWEQQRSLDFPAGCAVCGARAAQLMSVTRARGFLRAPEILLRQCVPHCARHAPLGPLFMFDSAPLGADVWWQLVGPEPAFLARTLQLNASGERLPPWRAFPLLSPESMGWRQGEGQHWLELAWRPFWSGLSPDERARYLERWPYSPDWAEMLRDSAAFGAASQA